MLPLITLLNATNSYKYDTVYVTPRSMPIAFVFMHFNFFLFFFFFKMFNYRELSLFGEVINCQIYLVSRTSHLSIHRL